MNGVRMPARFVIMLKNPPASPTIFLGARSVSTVQPRFVMPWPKNATDMMAITRLSWPCGTQFASTSDDAMISPDDHRQLPGERHRTAALDDPVGDHAADQAAERRRHEGERHKEAES